MIALANGAFDRRLPWINASQEAPRKEGYRVRAHLLTLASAIPPLALAAVWEVALAIPLPLSVYAAYAALMVALLALAWGSARRAGAPAAALLTGLLVLYAVPWTTRKAFIRDLHQIKPGMTECQAEAIMRPYLRGSGWPACPLSAPGSPSGAPPPPRGLGNLDEDRPPSRHVNKQMIYRHSNDPRFDSDWGVVGLSDGRVVNVEFLPD
jgi:hypothetical protein